MAGPGGRKAKVGRGEVRGSCRRTRQDAKVRLEKKFGGVVSSNTNPDPGDRTWAVSDGRSEVRESRSRVRGAW